MQFIAEFGSGNTCRNDIQIVEQMIDGLADVDSGTHDVVIKWQLFHDAPPNTPLWHTIFEHAYHYAKSKGYQTTASVFDRESLDFLLKFDVPFVKIACRPSLYPIVQHIPKDIPAYVSYPSFAGRMGKSKRVVPLACVPKYPAPLIAYERNFQPAHIKMGVSDHTEGWELYREYNPGILEKHVVLERTPDNPDSAVAVTMEELSEVLGEKKRRKRYDT